MLCDYCYIYISVSTTFFLIIYSYRIIFSTITFYFVIAVDILGDICYYIFVYMLIACTNDSDIYYCMHGYITC